MKQKIITLILISCICFPLLGQHPHEFSFNIGGGMSTLNFKPAIGLCETGYGGEVGLGYYYFFVPNFGIGTGVNLALYNSSNVDVAYKDAISAYTSKYQTNFEFLYSLTDYKEDISAMILTIPLMLQYQEIRSDRLGCLYVAVGGKVGIPLSAKYKTTSNLATKGYFANLAVTYEDDAPYFGFGNYQLNAKNDLDLKILFMLSGELGLKWRLGSGPMSLYTGGYIDYGLNNIRKEKPVASLITYKDQPGGYPGAFVCNSVTNVLNDEIYSLAVGLKLRLGFGYTPAPKVEAPAPLPLAPPPAPAPEPKPEPKPAPAPEPKPAPAPEPKPAPAPAPDYSAERAKLESPINGYDLSKTSLTKAQQSILDEKVAILKQHPEWTIRITGHTCDIGTAEVNTKVGLARAEAVKKYLVSKGIDAKRIVSVEGKRDTVWVGDAKDKSDANRKLNRRSMVICEICK